MEGTASTDVGGFLCWEVLATVLRGLRGLQEEPEDANAMLNSARFRPARSCSVSASSLHTPRAGTNHQTPHREGRRPTLYLCTPLSEKPGLRCTLGKPAPRPGTPSTTP